MFDLRNVRFKDPRKRTRKQMEDAGFIYSDGGWLRPRGRFDMIKDVTPLVVPGGLGKTVELSRSVAATTPIRRLVKGIKSLTPGARKIKAKNKKLDADMKTLGKTSKARMSEELKKKGVPVPNSAASDKSRQLWNTQRHDFPRFIGNNTNLKQYHFWNTIVVPAPRRRQE